MDLRSRLRWISLLQVGIGILYVLSAMTAITSFASVSREEARIRLGHDIPGEFSRVFINHGVAHGWPFGTGVAVLSTICAALAFALLLASAWYVRRLKSQNRQGRG